jgi:hypothetical protein
MADEKKQSEKASKIVKLAITLNKFGRHLSNSFRIVLIDDFTVPNALQSFQATTPPAGITPATNRTQTPLSDTSMTITVQVNSNASVKSESASHSFSNAATSAKKGVKGKGTARIFRNPRNLPRGSVSRPFCSLLHPLNQKYRLATTVLSDLEVQLY